MIYNIVWFQVWDYEEGKVLFVGTGHSAPIKKVKICPSSRMIISVGADGAILIWRFPLLPALAYWYHNQNIPAPPAMTWLMCIYLTLAKMARLFHSASNIRDTSGTHATICDWVFHQMLTMLVMYCIQSFYEICKIFYIDCDLFITYLTYFVHIELCFIIVKLWWLLK